MADLTSLKNDDDDDLSQYVPPQYGWGTELCLTPEQVQALGISDIAAGQRVNITAIGIVTSATTSVDSDSDSQSGKDISISIQLTDMSLKKSGAPDAQKAAALLYDKS